MIRLLSLVIYGLMHTTLEVVELIIIEVYDSTVFGVVARLSDGNDQAYAHWRFMAFTIPSLTWLQG
jgi:hypothetical protein